MCKTIAASLNEDYTHPVRDVLWGHIYMTEKQALLIESASFMRLNRIMQLGPVYLVYPGATHTRASHSIGVYHLGRRLLQNLSERGADAWLTPEGVKSFLAACLLHDLGHFPYTHSLKELSLSSHETLTGAIILKEPMKSLVGASGADPALTAAIIDREMQGTSEELLFYRRLLSGALDPDKLDYLNRDARYCGVPYGAQDVDFILSRVNPDIKNGVNIDSRLIPNVESVLFSKYLMYRTVYWHKQVRAATAMVKKALIKGLELGNLSGEDLYNLDDMSLFMLLDQKIGGSLVESIRESRIYATAAEISPEQVNIKNVLAIGSRAQFEEQLAEKLRKTGQKINGEDIIIDIPEPVSFETGLYVSDEKAGFSSSSSAFKEETVNAFIKTLYNVRIFINQKYVESLKTFTGAYSIIQGELEAINGYS
jgi:HD superfamily phosphohydrolase